MRSEQAGGHLRVPAALTTNRIRTPRAFVLGVLALLTLALPGTLAACSPGSDETGAEPAAEPLTAQSVLAEAAANMTGVQTAAFTLEQTGAGVAIDDEGQLRFLAARGRVARPSSADAVVTVEALGFTTEVGAVAIDGNFWFTNPLTGDWTEAPDSFSFDPAALFDPDDGLAALLTEATATAELVEAGEPTITGGEGPEAWPTEPEGDGPWHRVRATVSAERVQTLTSGLLADPTTVDAWIEQSTDRLTELRFEVEVGGETSQWRMTVTGYDIEVDITPPEQVASDS